MKKDFENKKELVNDKNVKCERVRNRLNVLTTSKKAATQIIRGAAKARFRRTLRAGLADARTAPYRKSAFTIAEVLITLAVIGIVAVMTIPTLVQGYTKPNTESKDLRQNGNVLALGNKGACEVEFGGICWTIVNTIIPISKEECETIKGELGINACNYDNDYWAGAVKQCGGTKNMPTMAQLADLASMIYGQEIGEKEKLLGLTVANQALYDTLYRKSSTASLRYFYVWSGEEYSSNFAYSRGFTTTYTTYDDGGRYDSDGLAVCRAD